MAVNKLVILLALSWLTGTAVVAARELPFKPGHDLAGRLDGGAGGLVECWNALLELKSCTNEIILFFLDGEAYLGIPCCRAIRVITHHCWPAMLTNLGFTSEEGDILRGYCDASSGQSPALSPANQVPVGLMGAVN